MRKKNYTPSSNYFLLQIEYVLILKQYNVFTKNTVGIMQL